MIRKYFLLLIITILLGCNSDELITPNDSNVLVQFNLFDTNGIEKLEFKQDEQFEMRLNITNLSETDLLYSFTGIPVVFEIQSKDSVITSSVDGLNFPQVILNGNIAVGESYSAKWIAPNSPAISKKITLPIGNYKAVLKHVFFNNYQLELIKPIDFVIIKQGTT